MTRSGETAAACDPMSTTAPRVTVTDVTLRDGNHTVGHQFSLGTVSATVAALDAAGVDIVEVGHGDGLGGSSVHVGRAAASDTSYIRTAVDATTTSKVAVLLVPGIGTLDDLRAAADAGAAVVRVGAHCTEADVTAQHIALAQRLGMQALGYLINASMAPWERVAEEALKMASYGADGCYIADSVGAFVPGDLRRLVGYLVEQVEVPIGFHGHNSLGLGVGNSLAAVEAGATMLDGSIQGFGGGGGNTQTEVLVAALARSGIGCAADVMAMLEAADVFRAQLENDPTGAVNCDALLMGYSGVYGGYLLPIRREADLAQVDARALIREIGGRHLVAGQEDVVREAALALAAATAGDP